MDKIEKVIYINLSHRQDRKDAIETQLRTIGFSDDKITRFDAIQTDFGGIGCGLSHIACLEYAIENKLNNIMIVEDDFVFTIDQTELNMRLTDLFDNFNSYDVYLLGRCLNSYIHIENIDTSIKPHMIRVMNSQAASCYIINASFMKDLIENYTEAIDLLKSNQDKYNLYAIDQYVKKLQYSKLFLTHNIPGGLQNPSYSDIEKKYVDYKV